MKYCFVILLFLSLNLSAQKWTEDKHKWTDWRTYDTLKCDSLKSIQVPKSAIVIEKWAYSDNSYFYNQVVDGNYVYCIVEQTRANVITGILQKRNKIYTKIKNDFDQVIDLYNLQCAKKHAK